MTNNAFTPERIAQLREILAKHNPEAVSCAMSGFPAALDEIERLSASITQAQARIARLEGALTEILRESDEFRETMPEDWDGDPLTDACSRARAALREGA